MMNLRTLPLAVLGIVALGGLARAEQPFRDGQTWCGDPDAVQSSANPYVQLAERNVTRTLATKQEPFWLAWAFAAQESSRRGDAAIKTAIVNAFGDLVLKQAAKKTAYWDLLSSLEAMRLLRRSPDFPAEQVTQWLTTLRPCVDANYANNTAGGDWTTRAPNTLHQSAAILQLASVLYDEKRYADLAASLVRKASTELNADGAYRYLPHSGPSQVYFGFDATFLGRYYQLSRDPLARDLLIRMAPYAKDALPNGLMETASAPWWKHSFSNGGAMHGVEIVAGLSRDPVVRALAEYRLSAGQQYFYSYYPQFFWDATIKPSKFGEDLCRFNTNFAGPQVRTGDWQVVMPSTGFADTFVGATVASGTERYKFEGQLGGAGIAILDRGVIDPAARPGSAIVAAPDDLKAVSLIGDDWIASAVTFAPRPFYFGDANPPDAAPWRVAQVWFADSTSLGGWVVATSTADTSVINGPIGVLQVDHAPVIEERAIVSGALSMKVWGDQVARLAIGKDGKRLQVVLSDVTERSYSAGQRWGFGLSCSPATDGVRRVTETGDPVLNVRVERNNGGEARLLFNQTDQSQTIDVGQDGGSVWRTSTRNVRAEGRSADVPPTVLAPGEMVVVVRR